MAYHPILGILIFLVSVLLAYFLGRKLIKNKITRNNSLKLPNVKLKNTLPPKGEITSPDAPWLKDK